MTQASEEFDESVLAEFSATNPGSEIERIPEGFRITRPWGDESLTLEGKGASATALAATLNRLVLPTRFSAIYHRDRSAMEFIWGHALRTNPALGRRFTFSLDLVQVECGFDDCSAELSNLVDSMRPVGPSSTDYRNLLAIKRHTDSPQGFKERFTEKVMSFWVEPVQLTDELNSAKLFKHINFYMTYYDRSSPRIIIHEPPSAQIPAASLPLLKPDFPVSIRARQTDELLLDFALAAMAMGEARLKFIYYYQILEYAAFYTVSEKMSHDLSTILISPDLQANIDTYRPKILDLLTDVRMGDDQKFERLIQERGVPEHVWPEVEANRNFFTRKHEFDGGFELEPLMSEDCSLDGFTTMWGTKIPSVLRRVRNALVHGREARTNAVIAPSPENDMRLRPLIPLIRRVAEDVIIYSD